MFRRTAGVSLADDECGISYRLLADEFDAATLPENASQADIDVSLGG
jgi:hypothetical protein